MLMRHLSFLVIALFALGCAPMSGFWMRNQEVHIPTVNNNVCKRLDKSVVLYAVFVDSEATNPWTTHDIESTLDSIRVAMQWVEGQAQDRCIPLNIEQDYHRTEKGVVPIEAKFTRKTLRATLSSGSGVKNVDRWADKIGREVLKTFPKDTAQITKTEIKPKDRERLIARIRDDHKVDQVALMYFINNYYSQEISVAMHTGSHEDPEYAIVSYKEPAVVAHEFLHLFGALDLYMSPFNTRKNDLKRKAFAMKKFPDEIMAFAYRNLDSLSISPFTEYLIGWDNSLDEEYVKMITNKKIKVAKY